MTRFAIVLVAELIMVLSIIIAVTHFTTANIIMTVILINASRVVAYVAIIKRMKRK